MTAASAGADPEQNARARRREISSQTFSEFAAKANLAAQGTAGFAERWAMLWANVFTVSTTSLETLALVGQFEREAIRPHVFGRFQDLTLAAEMHPAMLSYLDQVRSVGPNSRAGQRRTVGLNENLAREIMELHTVGSRAGYTQADVTELARSLTGWGVVEQGPDPFIFRINRHEPGPRTVLGKVYPQPGLGQGQAIVRDLANHPATARRMAARIASHFVADSPPPALVDRLESKWLETGGRLDEVAAVLIDAPESWSLQPSKMKSPYEFIISGHRALGLPIDRPRPLLAVVLSMGQEAYKPPSPEGWPDTAADWAGPDAMVKRLDWARGMGALAERRVPAAENPVELARAVLGPRLNPRTEQTLARAESRAEAITLFLMSPEFQRR